MLSHHTRPVDSDRDFPDPSTLPGAAGKDGDGAFQAIGDRELGPDDVEREVFIRQRAGHLLRLLLLKIAAQTDRTFAILLGVQWLLGVLFAWQFSGDLWAQSTTPAENWVWPAVACAALWVLPAAALAWVAPGRPLTRHGVAVGQMVMSALFIHLSVGRIETHFHIFGSLALLAFYRDGRVLATASVVVVLDHFLRGTYWPESVFCVPDAPPWRWLEHAGWIGFETFFLVLGCRRSHRHLGLLSLQQARLETQSSEIAAAVAVRTEELARTNQTLQAEIEVRRRVEAELQKAKEAAESASRAKSEFLANVSHEIRTPMNGVIGMTSLLLDTRMDEHQRSFVETIRQSGDSLLTIINDILDFSKIEAGCLQLEQQPFELRACVEEALELFTAKAGEKGLELGCIIHDGAPLMIEGDVTRLRQVLVNLIGNAVKFTDQGHVLVEVLSRSLPDTEDHELWFRVHDSGIGIPAEHMDCLFKLFSQVDTSLARRHGGTGLGLAISKRIVELMQGRIWAQSQPGQGSTFHFTVQLRAAAPTEVATRAQAASAVVLSGRHVLVVDDHEVNRRILRLQTQRWGMQSHCVASGAEALEWLAKGEPVDVVLLDRRMPGLDGLEVAEKIHALPERSELPLILLSSAGIGVEAGAPGRRHFVGVFRKPLKQAALRVAIERAISPGVSASSRQQVPAAREENLARRLPLRILVAEDNVVNQRVAQRFLERLGYRCDLVANGIEAVEAVERQAYDLILMDVQMPEMNGIEATRVIRQRSTNSVRPQIIALTAHARETDREECLASGMNDYLSKPLRPALLEQKLMQAAARLNHALDAAA